MENEKYLLRQQTLRRYILAMTRRGAAGIITDPHYRKRYLTIVLIITLTLLVLMRPTPDDPLWNLIPAILNIVWTAIWIVLCMAALPACGYIPGSWRMYEDLTRAGIVNFAGEAPLLIDHQRAKHNIMILTFKITGLPLEEWEESRSSIESSLNVYILSLKQGKDNQTFVLEVVPGTNAFQSIVFWQDDFLPENPAVLVLGVNAAGIPVTIDFSKIPNWLIGAAPGGGKTQLLLLMLHQFFLHGWQIYLADYKGIDFPALYHTANHYADNNEDLLKMLRSVNDLLTTRRNLLSSLGHANIDLYNEAGESYMNRVVVVLDETSVILDPTGRSKEEKAEIAEITGLLLKIGRLGRALGIHLIICTQRPDVGSIGGGAMKGVLEGRICGHVSDSQSSIVILDDGSGAKLPAIPGRFIVRDGSGDDKIIQAYLLNDKEGENHV